MLPLHRALVLALALSFATGCAERSKPEHKAASKPKKLELSMEELETGSGPKPKEGDTVLVHYTGRFESGEVFDSSYQRDKPIEVKIGEKKVIAGWEEALVEMQVGSKWKVIVPPEKGYGHEKHDNIPANSTLYFEMELIKIKPRGKKKKA